MKATVPTGLPLLAALALCITFSACGGVASSSLPPASGAQGEAPAANGPESVQEDGDAAMGIIGGADGPTVIFTTEGPLTLDSIGRYSPDSLQELPGATDYHQEEDLQDEIDQISDEDMAHIETLRNGYQARTMAQQVELLNELLDQSDTLLDAVATLGYMGVYDEFHTMDGFYASLHFTLHQYYEMYGPEHIRDQLYMFTYSRYFGEKYAHFTEKNFDYEKFIHMGYDIEIEYHDMEGMTVGQRDERLAKAILYTGLQLDTLTLEDWRAESSAAHLRQIIDEALGVMSGEGISFALYDVRYTL